MVEPGAGFPTHPHEEMEIITLVQSEQLRLGSMGNRTVMRRARRSGCLQARVMHSEFNLGREPVHFFQVWILLEEGA